MIIYNVTIKIIPSIEPAWVEWMRAEHIPDIINTGCFVNATMLRLLNIDESEGPTYAVQYQAPDKDSYDRYISQYSQQMRQKAFDKWGDGFIAFRTVMEVVN
jgi:hypothetical protein